MRKASIVIEELTEKEKNLQEQIENTTDAETKAALQSQLAATQQSKRDFQGFMTQDDIQAAEEANKAIFDARVQMSDFQAKLQEDGGLSVEQMMNVFEGDSEISDFFRRQTSEADKLRLMLAATTNEAQKLKIEVAQAGSNAATSMMQMQMDNGASQEEAAKGTQGVFDRISDMQLYDEDAIRLTMMISEEDSIEAINEGIDRVIASGNIEDFKVPVKISEEDLRKQTLESTQGYSKDNMEASVDIDTAKAFGDYLAKNAGDLAGYSEELETNAEVLRDVVESQGRYDAALKETQESYED